MTEFQMDSAQAVYNGCIPFLIDFFKLPQFSIPEGSSYA